MDTSYRGLARRGELRFAGDHLEGVISTDNYNAAARALMLQVCCCEKSGSGGRELIAIVDDDDSVRAALENLMKAVGLPARAFASAEEFLESGAPQRTSCLIADIQMPGMSGLELQAALNAANYRIPIIFITAHGDDKTRMKAMRAGALQFVVKPFDDEALVASARAAMESGSHSTER
jgi:FixJ family two-component response regulator